LGILVDEDNLGARLLSNFGVEASRVRQAIEVIVGRGPHPVEGSIEMTPRALAAEEAQRVQQQTISSEHILFGIVSLREGLAARILETLGPKGEKVRARISMALSGAERPVESTAPKGNVVTCRLTDHDLNALDALIEAGIRSTRSDAAAWLIHAGIEANQPLLEKVYGTVAEIRRLRSIAQSLVQPTQPDEQKTASDDKQP
jgi:ATP-dependent Clp protease ATP-binding subunit ClpA